MKLIVGLGNHEKEYEGSRHNIGFWVLDAVAGKEKVDFSFEKKLNAEIAKVKINSKPAVLLKPWTFVNKSGEAVKKAKQFYKLKNEDIIVVQDDLDIEFGSLKNSFGRDSGGHRGVESIIKHLKSNKFWRLRIGLANKKLAAARNQRTPAAKKEAVADFVLSKFSGGEKEKLKELLVKIIPRLEALLN